jgi:hypothetical protein
MCVIYKEGLSAVGTLRLMMKLINRYFLFQEAMLVKLKGLHYMSAPSFIDKLMMLVRPFLKKALMDVLHIHQVGSRTIDAHVPMEALPKESGGEFKTFDQARGDYLLW